MNQKEVFQKVYQGLNDGQRKAVDSLEGPVMVIAGPGTGKTQILGARIGKILIETDSKPDNILCLTYTEAGVVAMRKRLLSFIGPEAYKVNIYTFHAFCNEIIQENLGHFEKKALDPVSELERIVYFRELIDSFPKNHPLKRYRGDVYYEMNPLRSLFSTMKREGWTPEFLNKKIDEYIRSLADHPDFIAKRAVRNFKKGDIRTDKIAEETEKLGKFRAAVNEFERFQQIMRRHERYDFDDMINWVIEAFEKNENLLRRYQEQFLYILVDEYQDTSGTQNRLVELLINYWDKPNIFVVGDDDQSIFRFQGANVENMLALAKKYKNDLIKVVLTDNYRSVQPILNISKSLIERNQDRLVNLDLMKGLTKTLVTAKPALKNLNYVPHILQYETQRQEMAGITIEVGKLLSQGISPADIGIIYKENRWGLDLAQYLKLRNIPVFSKRSENVLEIPVIQKIITVLSWLSSEMEIPYSGDELLFEMLHYDWFGIPPIEIAQLSVDVAEKQFSEAKTSLRKRLFDKSTEAPRDLFSKPVNPNLKQASEILESLIADSSNVTLQMLLDNIIRHTGLLKQIMKSDDKIRLLQVLTAFVDFIKEETHRDPALSLRQLVSIIELMIKEAIALPLVEVSGSEKGVNLMTVHGSKGLEFDYIFFAGCNSAVWERKRKPSGNYKMPTNLYDVTLNKQEQGEEEEMRRLFYVAITRAALHLSISYSRFRNDGREIEPSMFIAEIQDAHAIETESISLEPPTMAEFQHLALEGEQAPEIEKIEDEFVTRLLAKFVMNVTALNNYLHCPLEFYYRTLLRIPSPKNESTEFGSAVHYALEQLFRAMQTNQDRFPPKEDFLTAFNWYMRRHRESFTREQFERRMEYGYTVLPEYYDKYVNSWNKIVAIERTIRNVVLNGVPLKGKLDKLEFDGKAVNVVDYKTGDPDKARTKLAPPNDKDPHGGDYWRQAVFYKILIDHYEQKQWQALSTEFDFIEPDAKKNYRKVKLVITAADITTVTQQISETWEKIQRHEFYTGCGKPDCHWCNFVKTNELAIALHESNEESEDLQDLRDN